MPDVKISALPASTTPLAGTEVLPIVQSATTRQVSVANLTAGRSVGGTNFIPSGSSAPTNGLYLPAANSLGFSTNSTNRATIDSSGNLGLGTTPSAWGATAPAIELPNFAISSLGNTGYLSSNSFFNTSNNFVYKNTAAATLLSMGTSGYQFNIAPSGTAGATISFTQAMTLDLNGNLLVGNSSSYAGKFQSWGAVTANAGTPNITAIDTTSMVSGVGGELAFIGQYQVGDYAYFGSIRGIKENATSGNTACALAFYTRPDATAPTERMRLTSAGVLDIGTGAGAVGQIQFPATAVPSANANTLDDYEEGTWTPSQGAGLTVVGTFSSSGTYTKIGNLVTAIGRVVSDTTVACSAGGVVTSNLPFTNGGFLSFGSIMNLNQSSSGVAFVGGGSTDITSIQTIAATQFIFFSVTYQV